MKEPDATLRLAQALILILRLSIYAPLLHCSIAHVFSPLALLQYTYLSLGCSKAQEQRMLNFARAQVGKPFSNVGMARSIIFPRTSNLSSFYCAGVFLLSNSQTLKLSFPSKTTGKKATHQFLFPLSFHAQNLSRPYSSRAGC